MAGRRRGFAQQEVGARTDLHHEFARQEVATPTDLRHGFARQKTAAQALQALAAQGK